jgi:propionyl-CoA synthetase
MESETRARANGNNGLMYAQLYSQSLTDPEAFWGAAAEGIDWERRWDAVLDDSRSPLFRWFSGARMNTAYNALDRHVDGGRADQPALIYDSPVTGTITSFSYRQLRDRVARFAGGLRRLGVGQGDRVLMYMPMVPEAVIAMLACARLGAIHSVVFGGFAAKELATRIDDATPKVIVAGSCGIEVDRIVPYQPLLRDALEMATFQPERIVTLRRPQYSEDIGPDGIDWEQVENSEPVDPVVVEATDPLYILYTSGTTGMPKGVVRDNGGHAVALHWSMKNLYDVEPGEAFWAASDVGWTVGHSYIVYGPLLAGNTAILYEGKPVGTPDPGAFWRVISQHRIAALFTAPTAFRAIKRDDPDGSYIGRYDIASLRTLFLAGERCDPDTLHWAEDHLGVPVIDHWWQTESGWPMVCNPMGIEPHPVKAGSAGKPVPGYDVRVLDQAGNEVPTGDTGSIVVRLPLPPGALPTLWNNDDGFIESYLSQFPGYYHTADAGFIDEDGYVSIMSRTDDIINVAGHRLSTGAMEAIVAEHPDVAECAVIGVSDTLKGQIPVALLVLKAGVDRSEGDVAAEVVEMVRDQIGPVASFKTAAVVTRLPKTRSGKILRRTLRSIADGTEWQMPATIDDPAILDQIGHDFARIGYPAD